ncbi:MAG: DUF6011 domain-containing protein [Proteobacteria bacterium]|nr:DUF6011 domain-containing protein [Pseudomonadota bacterium]
MLATQSLTPSAHQRIAVMGAAAMADARHAREAAARSEVMDKAVRFAMAHTDVMDWLDQNPSNPFAQSLSESLNKYGSLTEGQVRAVRNRTTAATAAPVIQVARIEEAFDTARNAGLKRLKMHLDTFEFKPAGEKSANAGGIYVTEDGAYLGKVMGGRFLKTGACSDDQQARVLAAASDPAAAAKAYGQRTGRCSICGRELTADESIERFVGPICASKYGF